jgi:hypothetical protein
LLVPSGPFSVLVLYAAQCSCAAPWPRPGSSRTLSARYMRGAPALRSLRSPLSTAFHSASLRAAGWPSTRRIALRCPVRFAKEVLRLSCIRNRGAGDCPSPPRLTTDLNGFSQRILLPVPGVEPALWLKFEGLNPSSFEPEGYPRNPIPRSYWRVGGHCWSLLLFLVTHAVVCCRSSPLSRSSVLSQSVTVLSRSGDGRGLAGLVYSARSGSLPVSSCPRVGAPVPPSDYVVDSQPSHPIGKSVRWSTG